jgi:rhamnose utilization protein RhaD (predicted bifunctional aldolase and dehydrogenase)
MKKKEILNDLITLSRNIGKPENDYVILAEGNTSASIDDSSFFVKASGYYMEKITKKGFVEMKLRPVLALLENEEMTDEEIKQSFVSSTLDFNGTMPSVESILHAVCIKEGEAPVVCHTHPTAVNAITCSGRAQQIFGGMLFPDEVVLCGPAVLYVDWSQPGLDLAKLVHKRIVEFKEQQGIAPRIIVMQNHGLITLGRNSTQVENTTHMFVKACRIRLGTYTAGGPRFMKERDIDRIFTRPDEKYREKLIFNK